MHANGLPQRTFLDECVGFLPPRSAPTRESCCATAHPNQHPFLACSQGCRRVNPDRAASLRLSGRSAPNPRERAPGHVAPLRAPTLCACAGGSFGSGLPGPTRTGWLQTADSSSGVHGNRPSHGLIL